MCFIVFFIIVMLSFSCSDYHKSPNQYEDNDDNFSLRTICEYNPIKAGANIQKRYVIESGIDLRYINSRFYFLKENEIVIFEITDDSSDAITEINRINYDLNSFILGINSIENGGIAVFNTKIITLLRTSHLVKESYLYKLKYTFLEININDKQTRIADNPFNISDTDKIKQIYYELSINKLYTFVENSRLSINEYVFNEDTFSLNNVYFPKANNLFLTKEGYYYIDFRWTVNAENVNTLEYYRYGNDLSDISIDLRYLSLNNSPISAFSDDKGNIWLYVREYDSETNQDKYELLKLKLLE